MNTRSHLVKNPGPVLRGTLPHAIRREFPTPHPISEFSSRTDESACCPGCSSCAKLGDLQGATQPGLRRTSAHSGCGFCPFWAFLGVLALFWGGLALVCLNSAQVSPQSRALRRPLATSQLAHLVENAWRRGIVKRLLRCRLEGQFRSQSCNTRIFVDAKPWFGKGGARHV